MNQVQGAKTSVGQQRPCRSHLDLFDMDQSGPTEWRTAQRICGACPFLAACRAELAELQAETGFKPLATIWAGDAYTSSGTILPPARFDRYALAVAARQDVRDSSNAATAA